MRKKGNSSIGGECAQKELNKGSFYTGNVHPQPAKLTCPMQETNCSQILATIILLHLFQMQVKNKLKKDMIGIFT